MPRRGLSAPTRPARRKPGDRRVAVRFAPVQAISCYWTRNGSAYLPARVYDVSAIGACLLLRDRLAPGDELTVELINGPHTSLCARTLRVTRVYQGNGNHWVVGGSFDRKLGYDELLPFIL
jgi:hypothetical protein